MNWDQIEGKWKQFTGSARERWGKLTDDDLAGRFLERTNDSAFVAWYVPTATVMIAILEALTNAGHANATFDPEPYQPLRCVSIAAMLAHFRRGED